MEAEAAAAAGIDSHAYPQAEVEQEEDVEGHVDLQREVLVEVLAGFDGTVGGKGHRRGQTRGRLSIPEKQQMYILSSKSALSRGF